MYINGSIKIGWFIGDGSKLHGYGKDTKTEGLFEEGSF